MTIITNLIDDKCPVLVDDETAKLGGSFYYDPLRPYDGLPLKWCYEELLHFKNPTLIDIGANTGCYTLLSKHHPHLKVYAFEPVHHTYDVLRKNIALNELGDRVDTSQTAISNYIGLGTLNTVVELGGSGVSTVDGTPAAHKNVTKSTVAVMTLDSFCESADIRPTFIKIDTEGNELNVLNGAYNTLARFNPFLLIEYSEENAKQYGYAPWEIIKLIESLGYVWKNPEGLDLWCVHKNWESLLHADHE